MTQLCRGGRLHRPPGGQDLGDVPEQFRLLPEGLEVVEAVDAVRDGDGETGQLRRQSGAGKRDRALAVVGSLLPLSCEEARLVGLSGPAPVPEEGPNLAFGPVLPGAHAVDCDCPRGSKLGRGGRQSPPCDGKWAVTTAELGDR